MAESIHIVFDQGTLIVEGLDEQAALVAELGLSWDHRIHAFRVEASGYRALLVRLVEREIPFIDDARGFGRLEDLAPTKAFRPYKHQSEALATWKKGGMAGVVVLPTGSGKTWLAMMAMDACRRDTLVVVPTLDLLAQWVRVLQEAFGIEVGMVGGGDFEIRPVTVITYDSAVRHMEHLGNRFGLLIFDEVHHLPGAVYSYIAKFSLAPFRLGLTATPDRQDGGEAMLDALVGPVLYSSRVSRLAGDILAPYTVTRVGVELTAEELEVYENARADYLGFCRERGLRLGSPSGWQSFLSETCRSRRGQQAFESYLLQKHIPLNSESKFCALGEIFLRHKGDRIIVFTAVNELAYRIARRYLCPVITHQTPPRERVDILARFSSGEYGCVVTSKVLNEGVDVPEANVGVVLSGSGSVREHVQRLGRILRKKGDKQAQLYEVIALGTHEENMSRRRRRHEAYGSRHVEE